MTGPARKDAVWLLRLFGIDGLASELVFPEPPAWGRHWATVSLMLSVAVWARFPLIPEFGRVTVATARGARMAVPPWAGFG